MPRVAAICAFLQATGAGFDEHSILPCSVEAYGKVEYSVSALQSGRASCSHFFVLLVKVKKELEGEDDGRLLKQQSTTRRRSGPQHPWKDQRRSCAYFALFGCLKPSQSSCLRVDIGSSHPSIVATTTPPPIEIARASWRSVWPYGKCGAPPDGASTADTPDSSLPRGDSKSRHHPVRWRRIAHVEITSCTVPRKFATPTRGTDLIAANADNHANYA